LFVTYSEFHWSVAAWLTNGKTLAPQNALLSRQAMRLICNVIRICRDENKPSIRIPLNKALIHLSVNAQNRKQHTSMLLLSRDVNCNCLLAALKTRDPIVIFLPCCVRGFARKFKKPFMAYSVPSVPQVVSNQGIEISEGLILKTEGRKNPGIIILIFMILCRGNEQKI
jgi:hypothetical protein